MITFAVFVYLQLASLVSCIWLFVIILKIGPLFEPVPKVCYGSHFHPFIEFLSLGMSSGNHYRCTQGLIYANERFFYDRARG
jgi:hypothetical protein